MSFLLTAVAFFRDCIFATVLLIAISVLAREGVAGLVRKLLAAFRNLHGVDGLINWYLRREVRSFLKQVNPHFQGDQTKIVQIPNKGKLLNFSFSYYAVISN